MRLRAVVLATAAAAAADTLAIVTEFRSGSTLLGGLVANASTFYPRIAAVERRVLLRVLDEARGELN